MTLQHDGHTYTTATGMLLFTYSPCHNQPQMSLQSVKMEKDQKGNCAEIYMHCTSLRYFSMSQVGYHPHDTIFLDTILPRTRCVQVKEDRLGHGTG